MEYLAEEYIDKEERITLYKHITDRPEHVHTHDFLEFVYIWCNEGHHVINEETFVVERGDLLILNVGDRHAFDSQSGMGLINILVDKAFFGVELNDSGNAMDVLALSAFREFNGLSAGFAPVIRFQGKELLEAEAILDFMVEEFRDKRLGYKTALSGYMSVLLAKIFRMMQNRFDAEVYPAVRKLTPELLAYIERNNDRRISLKELAELNFYTPNYFSRMFKECFGKTVTEYIHETRIRKAFKLLKQSELSVNQICNEIGYQDKKQFYKLFRDHYGMTPQQVRERQ